VLVGLVEMEVPLLFKDQRKVIVSVAVVPKVVIAHLEAILAAMPNLEELAAAVLTIQELELVVREAAL